MPHSFAVFPQLQQTEGPAKTLMPQFTRPLTSAGSRNDPEPLRIFSEIAVSVAVESLSVPALTQVIPSLSKFPEFLHEHMAFTLPCRIWRCTGKVCDLLFLPLSATVLLQWLKTILGIGNILPKNTGVRCTLKCFERISKIGFQF